MAAPRHATVSGSTADITMYQGDTFASTVTVYAPGGTVPLNLTGFAVYAHIRRGPADQYIDIAATIVTTITDAAAGTIGLALDPVTTTSLKGQYLWDLQLISPGGIVTTVLRGAVTVISEVTRV